MPLDQLLYLLLFVGLVVSAGIGVVVSRPFRLRDAIVGILVSPFIIFLFLVMVWSPPLTFVKDIVSPIQTWDLSTGEALCLFAFAVGYCGGGGIRGLIKRRESDKLQKHA